MRGTRYGRRTVAILLAALLMPVLGAAGADAQSAPPVTVEVSGRPLPMDSGGPVPYLDTQGRTEVPLRTLGTALGATVRWDPGTGTATLSWPMTPAGGAATVAFQVHSRLLTETSGRGKVTIPMDTVPQDIGGHLVLPVRYLAQAIGFAVYWDAPARRVDLLPGDAAVGALGYDRAGGASAALAAINRALEFDGHPPVTVPSGFWSRPAPNQFSTLLNLVRQDLGLHPLSWSDPLANLALQGARANTDPPSPSGSWSGSYGTVWSAQEGPVQSLYTFLFNDGYGSGNVDCATPQSTGCWIHRRVLLGHYGPAGRIGVAITSTPSGLSLAASLLS